MDDDLSRTLWVNTEWLAHARSWIEERLDDLGISLTGTIAQSHIRAWATAMRIPTDQGTIWFKATSTALGHESAITAALSRWVPGRSPRVLASDPARNWLLMADGGPTLRAAFQSSGDKTRSLELAAGYARLQNALVPRVATLLALGAPDCRLANFPALYDRLLEVAFALPVPPEDQLTPDESSRLIRLAPKIAAIAGELVSFGIPETLQHDDLHWHNVFAGDGGLMVFDWGDSSISHPFFSLVVLLRGSARDLGLPPDSPLVQQIRTAYLDAWDLPHSRADLDRACVLADALGRINRSLTYNRLLPGLDETNRARYASAVPGWLQEFLKSPALTPGVAGS